MIFREMVVNRVFFPDVSSHAKDNISVRIWYKLLEDWEYLK